MAVFSPAGLASGAASTCATHNVSSDAWAITLLSGTASPRVIGAKRRMIAIPRLLKRLLRGRLIDFVCLSSGIRTGEAERGVAGPTLVAVLQFPELQYQLCVRL